MSLVYLPNPPDQAEGAGTGARGTIKAAALVSIETPLGDSAMDDVNDAVRVNVVAGGGGGGGGTSMTDDSAFTAGTTAVTPVAGFFDSGRDTVNDGDAGALAMTAVRGLLASLETPTGDSAMDDTNDAVRVNIVAGAGSGGTAATDESTFTEGTTSFTPIGGVFNDSLASDPAPGEAAAARITSDRALHVNLRNASGTELGVLAAPVRVDPTGTTAQPVSQSGTWNVNNVSGTVSLPTGASTLAEQQTQTTALQLLDNAVATDGAAAVTGLFQVGGTDGTNAQILSTNASGHLNIADGGNTITVDGTVTANGGTGPFPVAGMAAHDAAVSGNPVLCGAEARDANGTAVAAGDAVRVNADRYGRLKRISPICTQASSNASAITTATDTTAVSAPGAGNRLLIHRIHAANSGATSTWVYWRSSTSGTRRYPAFLPQNGIISLNLQGAWALAENEALVITTSAAGNVEWHVDYETVVI